MDYSESAMDYSNTTMILLSDQIITTVVMPKRKWKYIRISGGIWLSTIEPNHGDVWTIVDRLTKSTIYLLFIYSSLSTKSYNYVYKRYWSTT